jgi:transposase-like protein
MRITELYKKYPTKEDLMTYLENKTWSGVPICPFCKSNDSINFPNNKFKCKKCAMKYTVITKTIFEHCRGKLHEWFVAYDLILNSKKRIPLKQLAIETGTTRRLSAEIYIKVKSYLGMYKPKN